MPTAARGAWQVENNFRIIFYRGCPGNKIIGLLRVDPEARHFAETI
jgi:hypothetical protein